MEKKNMSSVKVRPGFRVHWFNDINNRRQDALAVGFSYVMDAENAPISRCVGRSRDQAALYAYAMEIEVERFDEAMERLRKLGHKDYPVETLPGGGGQMPDWMRSLNGVAELARLPDGEAFVSMLEYKGDFFVLSTHALWVWKSDASNPGPESVGHLYRVPFKS